MNLRGKKRGDIDINLDKDGGGKGLWSIVIIGLQ